MSKHLEGCHLGNSLNEYEVILARAGIFRWQSISLEQVLICPLHRDLYGKYWRPVSTCQYPSHTGKAKALQYGRHTRAINLEMATQILDIYGVTVSIGSREY